MQPLINHGVHMLAWNTRFLLDHLHLFFYIPLWSSYIKFYNPVQKTNGHFHVITYFIVIGC